MSTPFSFVQQRGFYIGLLDAFPAVQKTEVSGQSILAIRIGGGNDENTRYGHKPRKFLNFSTLAMDTADSSHLPISRAKQACP